jgi:hypothetical protein
MHPGDPELGLGVDRGWRSVFQLVVVGVEDVLFVLDCAVGLQGKQSC